MCSKIELYEKIKRLDIEQQQICINISILEILLDLFKENQSELNIKGYVYTPLSITLSISKEDDKVIKDWNLIHIWSRLLYGDVNCYIFKKAAVQHKIASLKHRYQDIEKEIIEINNQISMINIVESIEKK